MTQWQKVYCDTYYNSKMPRSQKAKEEFRMLGLIGDTVTVEFPERTENYTVDEYCCNIPQGIISVPVLASNLSLWSIFLSHLCFF